MPSPFSVWPGRPGSRRRRGARRAREARASAALQVAEHRVAEDVLAVPAWLHEVEPGLGPGAERFTSRSGSCTGSGAADLVEEREDRRVGPDPERQREDGDAVTNGRLEERAEREPAPMGTRSADLRAPLRPPARGRLPRVHGAPDLRAAGRPWSPSRRRRHALTTDIGIPAHTGSPRRDLRVSRPSLRACGVHPEPHHAACV
jgi:hypothetical protein